MGDKFSTISLELTFVRSILVEQSSPSLGFMPIELVIYPYQIDQPTKNIGLLSKTRLELYGYGQF